jgi:hypothetical protein
MNFPWEAFLLWLMVALLGGALGTAELVSRYRDAPAAALRTWPALLYTEVDRQRAVLRASAVTRITQGLDYRKSYAALPPYCLALMQNLSEEAQRDLRKALELLDKDPMPDELKATVLGLELVNVVGVPVLDQAVKSLRDRIT